MTDTGPQPTEPESAAQTLVDRSDVRYRHSTQWEFPGCRAFHLSCDEAATYDGRIEFWDARTETAWVAEPTTADHEHPGQRLAAFADRIASVRGSPIQCYGTVDLRLEDEHGAPFRILQADQTVYLDPRRAELLGASAMVVGRNRFPDVVLEVDHTTDVRPSKLGLYQSWGFPEVWVEVPDRRTPSRPRSRLPGLTIHLREGEGYREVEESRAFPGWRAAEIHAAMNEEVTSARTYAVLERVGRTLGAREGTGPDDDPLLRAQRREGFEQGRLRGREEGLEEGREAGLEEGLARGRLCTVRRILRSRGIAVPDDFDSLPPGLAEHSGAALVDAALACESEADFLARLGHASLR